MRSATRFSCGLAVVLVLAGCSAEPTGDELPGRAPTPSAEASPSALSESPPGGAGVEGSRLSGEQLEAVLVSVSEAELLNAQVIPDAELRNLEEEAARRAVDIAVTPEECNVYAESGAGDLSEDASRAAMTFAGESSLQPDTISLSSLPSTGTAVAQVQLSRNQLNVCSEFTMDVSGQEIMTTVAEVQVETTADDDFALSTTAQVPGTKQESITVRAVVGSTVVDVLVGSSTDPAADIARAEALTDLVVAELRVL